MLVPEVRKGVKPQGSGPYRSPFPGVPFVSSKDSLYQCTQVTRIGLNIIYSGFENDGVAGRRKEAGTRGAGEVKAAPRGLHAAYCPCLITFLYLLQSLPGYLPRYVCMWLLFSVGTNPHYLEHFLDAQCRKEAQEVRGSGECLSVAWMNAIPTQPGSVSSSVMSSKQTTKTQNNLLSTEGNIEQ